jgi:5-methylcytosine-specific restriction endonuclease McrA
MMTALARQRAIATRRENAAKLLLSESFERLGKKRKIVRLLIEQNNMCGECFNPSLWLGKPLKLQFDHRDGDTSNNSRANVWMLCPNCHSQTPTYCGRNKRLKRLQRGAQ